MWLIEKEKRDTDLVYSSSFCCHHLLSFFISNKNIFMEEQQTHGTWSTLNKKKKQSKIEGKKLFRDSISSENYDDYLNDARCH